jgi:hypothetical protein
MRAVCDNLDPGKSRVDTDKRSRKMEMFCGKQIFCKLFEIRPEIDDPRDLGISLKITIGPHLQFWSHYVVLIIPPVFFSVIIV